MHHADLSFSIPFHSVCTDHAKMCSHLSNLSCWTKIISSSTPVTCRTACEGSQHSSTAYLHMGRQCIDASGSVRHTMALWVGKAMPSSSTLAQIVLTLALLNARASDTVGRWAEKTWWMPARDKNGGAKPFWTTVNNCLTCFQMTYSCDVLSGFCIYNSFILVFLLCIELRLRQFFQSNKRINSSSFSFCSIQVWCKK